VIVFFAAPVTRIVARLIEDQTDPLLATAWARGTLRTGCLAGPMVIGLDDSRGRFAVAIESAPRRADLQRR
jgi:hypothetical protein